MAKLTLDFEEAYDFELIGICSHVKDYRLSWELNKKLEFDFIKERDYELNVKGEAQLFSFFSYLDDENKQEFYLINNRSDYGILIPEEKKVDYFLLIKGYITEEEKEHLLEQIGNIKNILTTYHIEVETLKSKGNLLF